MSDTSPNFIQRALHAIGSLLGFIKKEATDLVHIADKVVDELKAFDGTAAGKIVETAASLIAPDLVNAFKLWLPTAFKALNWANDEISKTDEQIFEDALKYVSGLKGDYKAVQLNGLQSLIAKWLADNNGIALPIQQALTISQVVHNPTMVATA